MKSDFLGSAKQQLIYYKLLAEKTFGQLTDEQLHWQYNGECNSIAMIVNHLSGNMISRWTDIFSSDGEKPSRDRDAEFVPVFPDRKTLLRVWENGWNCLLHTIESLDKTDLNKVIYIRNTGHTITEAINRQLAHYTYHIGQIVFVGKMILNEKWTSLSIPKGQSAAYNAVKFSIERQQSQSHLNS